MWISTLFTREYFHFLLKEKKSAGKMASSDLMTMDKSEVSKSLFGLISWDEVIRSGAFLGHNDHQLLEKSQTNLAVILDSPSDAKNLATILLKIADNCTSNLTVQQYVFTRVEEILGLGMDFSDESRRLSK